MLTRQRRGSSGDGRLEDSSPAVAFLIMYFLPLPLPREQHNARRHYVFPSSTGSRRAIRSRDGAVALALCVLFNVPGVGPNAEDAPGDVVFGAFADTVIFRS